MERLQVHLLALHEEEEAAPWAAGAAAAKFGFAFLDAAAGRYYVGAVSDDAGRANLSALLTQVGTVYQADSLQTRSLPDTLFASWLAVAIWHHPCIEAQDAGKAPC